MNLRTLVLGGVLVDLLAVAAVRAAVPPAGVTVILASKAGAVLNSDLMKGGGMDDTAALQAILNRAASGKPVHLIIDGAALVNGLDVYGNTTIECPAGGGLYLKDQASRSVIRNVHRSRGAVTDEHITIIGCFINGNRFNQLHKPPSETIEDNQEADHSFVSGVQLLGVKDVTLEQLTLWSSRSFGIHIANAEHIVVRDVRIDNGSPAFDPSLSAEAQLKRMFPYMNTDGVHLNGPIRDAVVDGLTAHPGDDALALNANDGPAEDMTVHNDMGPYVGQGPVTDVIARNIMLDDAAYGVRMYSIDQRIDRVIIEGITGTIQNRLILLSHWITKSHVGNFGSVLVDNVNVRALPILPPRELFASLHATDVDWDATEDYPLFSLNSPIENLSLQHVMVDMSGTAARPLIQAGPQTALQRLSADISLRDPDMKAIPLQVEKGARIERLSWALDWNGKAAGASKSPILNRGGVVDDVRWMNPPPDKGR
jgi:hypothetical protein